ncbi:MAG: glycine cleavage system aminomethyltransferase GcvT, partial [Anaerolineaceae bacterium]|nr:glycine cleavage system aminomethyltransferase GcvT [Anaerolineaceae bacterium]
REAIGSVFQNVYAEGYPHEITRHMPENEILDYKERLGHYRRFADPRYYKGVEYADIVEAIARQRCAELFATESINPNELYVNVQPLSGAPANNAVYLALLNPGDTLMGMNLLHGGHLTHGSPVNRSGKLYHIVSYEVNPETEQIDYDAVEALALQSKPKVIVAGYSSYPIIPDWARFREIADKVGAILLTDISHIAGLIAAKIVPSPVGHAQIITFTTHKTLCGPRGACIIAQNKPMSDKIDRAVFPGEQGGPHLNTIAALAVAFKFAATDKFKKLQQQIVDNCKTMADQLTTRGFHIPYGGTNSHLANIDCKSVKGPDGTLLNGDLAARILDVAGIVTNRNTIPGDKSALRAYGVRFGTPWITQRGFMEEESRELANIIADILHAITPYKIASRKGFATRAKVDFNVLEQAKIQVRSLCQKIDNYQNIDPAGYPFNFYIDDVDTNEKGFKAYDIKGKKASEFVNFVFQSDVESLNKNQTQNTQLYVPTETVKGILKKNDAYTYQISIPANHASCVAAWLRDLSDAYTYFDEDLLRRMPGVITVSESTLPAIESSENNAPPKKKPYFIGQTQKDFSTPPLPPFEWHEDPSPKMKRTALYNTHVAMGGKMVPFAGWEMPVQYTSIMDEHSATRNAAGLFDVSHMGVFQAEGPDAVVFLNSVCGNDISALAVGESCYTHFLDPDANVIDDLIVYRRDYEIFLVVVNASNDDKNWAWLNAVKNGSVKIDNKYPNAFAFGRNVILRNLRNLDSGSDMRVDIALQGPRSLEILLALGADEKTTLKLKKLKRSRLCDAIIGGYDLIVSRTAYTGETVAFDFFIHPDRLVDFWNDLINAGSEMGLKPCGLGARDSLRTEFGLPLYGHELAGPLNCSVGDAGFSYFVKPYKPWFIGRDAFLEQEKNRKQELIRFQFSEQRTRKAHLGDPVLNEKGKVIGRVTSCAIDSMGFFTGQALINKQFNKLGNKIFIYQGAPDKLGKTPANLYLSDRVLMPSKAIIISRYLILSHK